MISITRTSILLLIFFSNIALAETITGKVVGVMDGDTFKILDNTNTQFKVRLSGIDAPEKKQAFYDASKQSLSKLIFDKQVKVDYKKYDRYGRIVGKVIIDGTDANLEQIKQGYAWFYKQYQNELVLDDRLNYLHAHEAAEADRQGLWVDPKPIPPWEFRKAKKGNQSFENVALPNQDQVQPYVSPVIIHKLPVVKSNNSDSKNSHCLNNNSDSEILACLNN